ncbi:MAG TPA: hypothetical protein PLZ84_09525, partial [Clostridia bacterium]|nr:hypothetical protein [Clostridia bacterium]
FILVGLYSLSRVHEFFSRAIPFGWLSGLIGLLDIYQPNYPFEDVPGWLFSCSIFVGLFALIFNLFLFYYIIFGVSSLLADRGFMDLAAQCKTVWYCYLVARIAVYLMVPMMALSLSFSILLSIPLIIFNIAIFIMFLVLLKKAYRYLS